MTLDPHANFPYSFVETPPSPADSGTTLKLRGGGTYHMPRGGAFNAVVWKAGVIATYDVSEIVRCSTVVETTIASGSNGLDLPQAIINVASSASFDSAGGTCAVETADGIQIVSYTGKGSGTLTGCSGGEGTMSTGGQVVNDKLTIARAQEGTTARLVKIGDQFMAAITKKMLTDIEGAVTGAAGTEIGYDQITAPVTVASTTEATGTLIIPGSAHAFDGAKVYAEFYCPRVIGGTNGYTVTISLFEGSTQIFRMAVVGGAAVASGGFQTPVCISVPFTPSAGNHTYKITAHCPESAQIYCGVGGTATDAPAYLKFTKA